jgi:hypothetical protein
MNLLPEPLSQLGNFARMGIDPGEIFEIQPTALAA